MVKDSVSSIETGRRSHFGEFLLLWARFGFERIFLKMDNKHQVIRGHKDWNEGAYLHT